MKQLQSQEYPSLQLLRLNWVRAAARRESLSPSDSHPLHLICLDSSKETLSPSQLLWTGKDRLDLARSSCSDFCTLLFSPFNSTRGLSTLFHITHSLCTNFPPLLLDTSSIVTILTLRIGLKFLHISSSPMSHLSDSNIATLSPFTYNLAIGDSKLLLLGRCFKPKNISNHLSFI